MHAVKIITILLQIERETLDPKNGSCCAKERFSERRHFVERLLKARGHFNSCDNKCLRFACIRDVLDAWHVAGPVFVQARMANRTRSLKRVSPGFVIRIYDCIVPDALIRLAPMT